MKIERKIVLSNVFNVGLIVLTGLFALQNMNRVLTKLRFVEIADDLGASFLEMRLAEKNFFLYEDETALDRIRALLEETRRSIESVRKEIALAIGPADVARLEVLLEGYARAVEATLVLVGVLMVIDGALWHLPVREEVPEVPRCAVL